MSWLPHRPRFFQPNYQNALPLCPSSPLHLCPTSPPPSAPFCTPHPSPVPRPPLPPHVRLTLPMGPPARHRIIGRAGDTPAGTLSVRLEDNVAQREWLPKFGLHITIVSGKGLGPQPHRTRADPSVQLDVGAGTWNTGIQRLTLDPEFGHRFHVPIETGEETVACTVIDNDMRPVIVGYGEVALQALSLAKSLRYEQGIRWGGNVRCQPPFSTARGLSVTDGG